MSFEGEARRLFARHGYHRLLSLPSKRLSVTRMSFFPTPPTDASCADGRNTIADVLYAPLELPNIFRYLTGRNQLFKHSVFPGLYTRLLKLRHPTTHLLVQLFFLQQKVPVEEACALLTTSEVRLLTEAQFLSEREGDLFPQVRVVPYRGQLFVESTIRRTLLASSFTLADAVDSRVPHLPRHDRMLDLCTGSGIIASLFSDWFRDVVAVDVDPLTLAWAQRNGSANQKSNISFQLSDLYQNVSGRFDLITANPPYLFVPDHTLYGDHQSFSDGGEYGTEVTRRILDGVHDYLADGGLAVVQTASSIVGGRDLLLDHITALCARHPCQVDVVMVSNVTYAELLDFYRRHDISARPQLLITIKKGGKRRLRVEAVALHRSVLYSLEEKVAKAIHAFAK